MAWLRLGDNAATHPLVMALAAVRGGDERTMNEVTGFVWRAATLSAGHYTDHRVDLGLAQTLAGRRAETLLRQAVDAGLMVRHGRGKARTWQIVEDPDFLHMRTRGEVDRDKRRRDDAKDLALTVPVRLRDGDQCRYCRLVVYWTDRRGARGATYDHLDITRSTTPDLLVVACKSCNSRRGDAGEGDDLVQLQPPPRSPYYSRRTADWLTKNGQPTQASDAEPVDVGQPAPDRGHGPERAPSPRPDPDQAGSREPGAPAPGRGSRDPARDTAKRDPARDTATSSRPGDPAPDPAPSTWDLPPPGPPPEWAARDGTETGPTWQKPADPDRSGLSPPGRVGSGGAGQGASRSQPASPARSTSSLHARSTPRPRSRRGRRGRT